jgi:V8-like Glu-specific endopeptidase
MKIRASSRGWIGVAAMLMASGTAVATEPGLADPRVPVMSTSQTRLGISSGAVANNTNKEKVVWSQLVTVPNASSLRLSFKDVVLAGGDDRSTTSYVRITNQTEKAVQFLDVQGMKNYGNKSAYFNGNSVLVEIVAKPGTGVSQLTIDEVIAGMGPAGGVASQCGPTEDRVASSDVRVGRMVTSPTGGLICTAWLIDDANHMFLSAGHCLVATTDIIEFNCPPSTAGGAIVHPGPEDQYPVDGPSRQTVNGGWGNDWSYFGCNPNSNTGLTAYQAQADFFNTINAPAAANQLTRVTGFGIHPTPVLNGAQHTDTGAYTVKVGTQLRHTVDTDNGDSGSPVFLEGTSNAFGIHTHGWCDQPGLLYNGATDIANAGLQNALSNPLGICAPLGVGDPTGPLYFAGDAAFDSFGTVNRETGLYGAIGPGTSGDISSWQGLAYNRVNNVMYATAQVSGTVRLYTVNVETGQVSFIGNTNDSGGSNIFIEGLAYDPNSGTLYGYSQLTNILHVINKGTGAVSNIGGAQAGVTISGIDYDPVHDKLYGIDDAPAAGSRLVTISTNNGTVLPVGTGATLGANESDCDSLAYSPDDGYCYTVDQADNTLIRIDPATGLGVVIGPVDQPNSDGGMASVAGDCGDPIQPAPVNPPHGATGVSVNLPAIDWFSANSEYCGSTQVPGSLTTAGIPTPFRGHFFEIMTAHTMTEIKADLSFPIGNRNITWAAYEFEEGSGTGQLIFADTQVEVGTGIRKQYTSGKISIPMKAGHWYAAGWHYNGGNDVTFYRDTPVAFPSTGAAGLFQGGFATNSFAGALPATTSFASLQGAAQTTRYAMEYCFDPRCFNPTPGAPDAFATANVVRGNVVRMDQNKTLTEIEAELSFVGAQTVTFVVYEGGDTSTPGDLIFAKVVNLTGTGKKLYSSGAINVDLRSDRTYAIGFHKTGSASYYREVVASVPIDFQYGSVQSGFGIDGVAAVPGTVPLTYALPESLYDINMCFAPAEDTLIPGDLSTDVAATVGNLIRGTVINCEKDTVLESYDMRLALATAQPVHFVVYEANAAGGLGSLLIDKTVNFPASGESWKNSGAMNVALEKGKVYLIGIQKVSTDITYYFENTTGFVKFYDFGTVLGGYTQNGFPTVPPTLTVTPDTNTIYTMRINFSCETWYDVFFGTAANPPKTGRTTLTVGGLGAFLPLAPSTKHYWKVIAHNCCGFRSSDGPFEFTTEAACYPDCDLDGVLTIDDFICFQTYFAVADPYADCDGDGVLTIDDFICFQTFFAIGC